VPVCQQFESRAIINLSLGGPGQCDMTYSAALPQ